MDSSLWHMKDAGGCVSFHVIFKETITSYDIIVFFRVHEGIQSYLHLVCGQESERSYATDWNPKSL